MLLRAFIESQFSYWPLIWMFHSKALNNKINRLHENGDYKSKFDELLEEDSYFSIHKEVYIEGIPSTKIPIAKT